MENDYKEVLNLEIDDPLDKGIDFTEQSIVNQQILNDSSTQEDNVDKVTNPFYENAFGGDIKMGVMKNIYANHKNVLILCLTNQSLLGEWFFEKYITKENFEKIKKSVILTRGPLNMLNNITHRKNAKIIQSEYLTGIQLTQDTVLNAVEVVIPLLDFSFGDVEKYIKLYGPIEKDPRDIFKIITLYKYYKSPHSTLITNRLFDQINQYINDEFWKFPTDEFNMTQRFNERVFVYRNRSIHSIADVIATKENNGDNHTQQILNKLQSKYNRDDYLKGINKQSNKVFIDIGECVKSSARRKYYINDPITAGSLITHDDVNTLFGSICGKELYDMFNIFATSKQYCHLVINNINILRMMKPLFTKFGAFYRYLLSYPFLSFYIEECIFKSKTKKENRYVFTIDTAHELPFYPYIPEDIHMSPYCTLPLSKEIMNLPNSFWSLQLNSTYKQYGIDTLENFRKKFNLFTTGTPDHNVFDGLKWDKFAVSGSVIPACVPIRSPLVDLVKQINSTSDQEYLTFFDHFYHDSDIDLMCNEHLFVDFLDKVYEVYNVVKNNIMQVYQVTELEAKKSIKFESIKSCAIIIHKLYIKEKLDEIKEYIGHKDDITIDEEWIIKNISENAIKEYFYKKYFDYKFDENQKFRANRTNNNPLYEDFLKVADISNVNIFIIDYLLDKEKHETCDNFKAYYLNDIVKRVVPADENHLVLKLAESIRIKIIKNPECKAVRLLRNIEVFKTQNDDPFSTVAKFHLPCVRAYYNGNNVYMLPSCVNSLITGLNVDYKYFHGARDPIEIINKYVTRGFGIILSGPEKTDVVKYNTENPKWSFFEVNQKNKPSVDALWSPKKIDSSIFKLGLVKTFNTDNNIPYLNEMKDLVEYYKVTTGYNYYNNMLDLFKLKAIDDTGNINPIKPYTFELAYQILNSNN